MIKFNIKSLKNFLLNLMKWERIKSEIFRYKERMKYAKTIYNEFTQILFIILKELKSARNSLRAMSFSLIYDLTEKILK